MTRLLDWPVRLQAVIAQRLCTPFGWGVHDCCLFAAACADACTGGRLVAELEGRYASERGAYRLLRSLAGEGGLAAVAACRLGSEISPAMARRGDIGLIHQSGRELLTVCNGSVWLAPGPAGLLPAPEPERVWSV